MALKIVSKKKKEESETNIVCTKYGFVYDQRKLIIEREG